MGKFYAAFLFIILLFSCVSPVLAQQQMVDLAGQKELRNLSVTAKQTFSVGHTKALSLAALRGWTVLRKTKQGNLVSLQGVNQLGFPIYLITHNNTTAAATTGTNTIQPGGSLGLNLSGSSTFLKTKLGIWDGGTIYKSHQEFAGKTITSKDAATIIQHSTHVAGTLLAKGVYAPAKGMSFGATTLQSWDFDDDVSEMSDAASGLLLSNHSYGDIGGWDYNSSESRWEWYGLPGDTVDYNFGFYDERAQSWDKIAYHAPYYLIVESAGNSRSSNGPEVGKTYYGFASRTNATFINKGKRPATISNNDGYDIITTTGTAKNIITVGSVSPLPNGPVNRTDVSVSYFSSWGPTDDGRIKPDIVADGEDVTSTSNESKTSYTVLSGTSMAAPNVTGSLYLLQEYYAQKHAGSFMRAATLKALACHTAFDAGRVGPDYIYGWGLLDMKKAAQAIIDNNKKSLISENTLQQGETKTFEFTASGNGPFAVSIVWTDPEGTPTHGAVINDRTPKLVNDLDIRISDGTSTFLPWVLNPDNPSLPATTGDNIRDNIEQIYIANATPGKKYTVTVSHKATLSSGKQAYSLIATGIGGVEYCASAPLSTADSKISNFELSTVNYTPPSGCTGYTDNTGLTAQLEQAKTYTFNITLGTCGAELNKAAKVFIDWNGNGVFENNELAATTTVFNTTSIYTGKITVPASVTPGNFSLMRVVLVETADTAAITPCGTYNKGETQDYRVQFLKPAIDVTATAIANTQTDPLCAVPIAPIVRLKNIGRLSISNIPVTVTVKSSTNVVTVFNEIYTGTLAPAQETDFILNSKFNTVAGSDYTITAQTHLPGDLVTANDKTSGIIKTGLPPTIDNVMAYFCTNTGKYQLSGNGDGQLLWYKSVTDAIPFAYGTDVMVDEAPVNGKYYAGLNDFKGSVGPATKNVFSGGGYNQFTPGIEVTTKIPITIESARLYIGNSGKITFTATDDDGKVVSSVILNVNATRNNPQAGELTDDPADQGRVYRLNLTLPAAGHYTITPTYDNNATIYRNNGGVAGYPFNIGNIFSISGNGATPEAGITDSTYYRQYYYYFYDMQVKSAGCPSNARTAVTLTKPVITQNGDVLNSNIATANQWLLNGKVITGETGQSFTPLQSGIYKVQITLKTGCVIEADSIYYMLIAKNPDKSTDIGLTIFPVPANTYLNAFFVAKSAGLLKMALINSAGQTVYNNTQNVAAGNVSTVINTVNRLPGTYILRITLGQKTYSKKIIIEK